MPAARATLFRVVLLALGVCGLASTTLAATISGRVFEDLNYGGGAGRSLTASGGVGINGVRVELYGQSGANFNFVSFTTTATVGGNAGSYSFTTLTANTYRVRVVNGTVDSSRGGCTTTCVPVQTYRTNANTGTAVAVTDRVGGEDPRISDAPNRTGGNLAGQTQAGTYTPQSLAPVVLASDVSTVGSVDFGFNFSTIVNTRDAADCSASGSANSYFPCQGTLRQFIINANAHGGSLSQSGSGQLGGGTTLLPSGSESSIFMVPHGTANPGQNTGYADQLTSGVAVISLAAALPTITRASLRLDGTTQTVNVGNTNGCSAGTGGAVGVLATSFPQFGCPEVQVAAGVLAFTGTGQAIHGFALPRGSITMSGANAIVRDNFVGVRADGTADSGTDMAIVFTGGNTAIRSNYASANNSVIRGNSPGAGAVISYNEVIRSSMTPTDTFDGILLIGSATNARIENNLARNQAGAGIELGFGGGTMSNVVITNNTVRNNGYSGATASTPSAEPVGIAAWDYVGSSVEISLNRIESNAGPGLLLSAATTTRITQNRFGSNGGLAIDLNLADADPNAIGTGPGPSPNDTNDTDGGANGLLNFPVITAATIANGEFSIAGFARPGSAIELYVAQADPSGFGEGLTYIGTFTEGGGADIDTTTGSYSGVINGVNQGSDTTNRFLFRGSVPSGVAGGVVLTSTATLANQTSEFGGNVTVTGGPNLVHSKTVSVDSDPVNNTTNPKSIPGALQLYAIRITNQGTGTVDNDTIQIVDPIPVNTTLCGLAAAPVTFVDGSPVSGLAMTFSGLNSTTDDVDFSNTTSGAPVWGYTPLPTNGCDPAVRYLRVRPRGTMAGGVSGNPYFEIRFRVRVE